jgi:hypothetical protein
MFATRFTADRLLAVADVLRPTSPTKRKEEYIFYLASTVAHNVDLKCIYDNALISLSAWNAMIKSLCDKFKYCNNLQLKSHTVQYLWMLQGILCS